VTPFVIPSIILRVHESFFKLVSIGVVKVLGGYLVADEEGFEPYIFNSFVIAIVHFIGLL
jgi:hypothetical protein